MSHSTNNNVPCVNFCDVCNLFFGLKKGLYKHQSYDSNQKELLEKMFDSDADRAEDLSFTKTKTESDEDVIYLKPSTKTKTETSPKKLNPILNLKLNQRLLGDHITS